MPSIVPLEEFEEVDEFDPDELGFEHDFLFKMTTSEGTDEACSPDEVCDLILDAIEDQFWDWWADPTRRRRFKPRIKVYEVY
ncbi:hypothetical protein SH661x_004387 [Planctomicrobium sp. SH661]|uniref:hypothetical protein n=1 Tax=Planctomicrobium sp. SH661 TaxID=3448124 RepID=UPI003F5C666C